MKYKRVFHVDAWKYEQKNCSVENLNQFCKKHKLPRDRFSVGRTRQGSGIVVETASKYPSLLTPGDYLIRLSTGRYTTSKAKVFEDMFSPAELTKEPAPETKGVAHDPR